MSRTLRASGVTYITCIRCHVHYVHQVPRTLRLSGVTYITRIRCHVHYVHQVSRTLRHPVSRTLRHPVSRNFCWDLRGKVKDAISLYNKPRLSVVIKLNSWGILSLNAAYWVTTVKCTTCSDNIAHVLLLPFWQYPARRHHTQANYSFLANTQTHTHKVYFFNPYWSNVLFKLTALSVVSDGMSGSNRHTILQCFMQCFLKLLPPSGCI